MTEKDTPQTRLRDRIRRVFRGSASTNIFEVTEESSSGHLQLTEVPLETLARETAPLRNNAPKVTSSEQIQTDHVELLPSVPVDPETALAVATRTLQMGRDMIDVFPSTDALTTHIFGLVPSGGAAIFSEQVTIDGNVMDALVAITNPDEHVYDRRIIATSQPVLPETTHITGQTPQGPDAPNTRLPLAAP